MGVDLRVVAFVVEVTCYQQEEDMRYALLICSDEK